MRLRSTLVFVVGTVCLLISAISRNLLAGDNPAKVQQVAVLHFPNSDYVTGTLVASPEKDCLGWQSPLFTAPFVFPIASVTSIHFSSPPDPPQPEGVYGFELAGGDLLFGSLLGLDSHTAILDVPGLGQLNVDRSTILRMYRRGGGNEQLYVGPTGLNGWKTSGEHNDWREDSGHLTTSQRGAILRRDVGIPNLARFEFELSWTAYPDFELAIGVDETADSVSRAFRFEVWDTEIVVQRETEREADLAHLKSAIDSKGGRLHIQGFLDQAKGRMLVYSASGAPLADLTVPTLDSNVAKVFGGIQLTNRKGDIRLERLQIGRWNGETPRQLEVDTSRIHGTDGTIIYGTLKSYDAQKREFMIATESDSHSIAEDSVQDLILSRPAEIAPRPLRAVFLSGVKISGELLRVEKRNIVLKSPGIEQSIVVPIDALQTLVVLAPTSDPPASPQRKGRLEINGMTLHGCLVDNNPDHDAEGCLTWQPASSTKSSVIQKGISGRIVYRDSPLEEPVQTNEEEQSIILGGGGLAVRQRTRTVKNQPRSRKKPKSGGAVLHLRTGDTIPCEAISIDERGLTFQSAISEATFVVHSQIQALELLPNVDQGSIDPKKKSRLLTVPRMQRDNPPTHLIRSVAGDYLRGRLVSMDNEQIQVELRLDTKIIVRDRVARILWLHPEATGSSANPEKTGGSEYDQLVQALPSDGNRLTFIPEQVSGSVLSGKSELLGVCRVDLQNVDQLFMGAAIDQATADLPFQWKLKKAADPLGPKEGGSPSGDGAEGQDSALVGKMAPEIGLKTLDGTSFQLSTHNQKVVILDFWASWCGPCLQVMPQIDRVAHEFTDQGVELFAVNLEESPEKVKAALERLKLSTTVLLDRDGRIAEKYGATSIPQTVIIGRDGKVARVFVGGGARFDEQLREALKAVLSDERPSGN